MTTAARAPMEFSETGAREAASVAVGSRNRKRRAGGSPGGPRSAAAAATQQARFPRIPYGFSRELFRPVGPPV
jgi:hypothetical protein